MTLDLSVGTTRPTAENYAVVADDQVQMFAVAIPQGNGK